MLLQGWAGARAAAAAAAAVTWPRATLARAATAAASWSAAVWRALRRPVQGPVPPEREGGADQRHLGQVLRTVVLDLVTMPCGPGARHRYASVRRLGPQPAAVALRRHLRSGARVHEGW